MDGTGAADGGFADMDPSAIQEVTNITTSGFIDGWADVLETTIDISTPTFVYGPAGAIVDQMSGWPDSELVFVFDSHVIAADEDLGQTVYTFPRFAARRPHPGDRPRHGRRGRHDGIQGHRGVAHRQREVPGHLRVSHGSAACWVVGRPSGAGRRRGDGGIVLLAAVVGPTWEQFNTAADISSPHGGRSDR